MRDGSLIGPVDAVAGTGAPAVDTGDAVHGSGTGARVPAAWRRPTAVGVGVLGLALYNWWAVVAAHSHLLSSPDELFSDLEAAGRPDAALLQHLDLAAGLVLVAALLVRGRRGPGGRRAEWPWMVAFAASGAVGGHFAYACPEGLSAACRSAEWRLALPPHHYVHVLAGVAEFATATIAVYLAWQRTRAVERPTTRAVRWIGRALVVSYPLLGLAYLSDRMGAFVEPIFFVCFSAMVVVELVEPDRAAPGTPSARSPRAQRPLEWAAGAGVGAGSPVRLVAPAPRATGRVGGHLRPGGGRPAGG